MDKTDEWMPLILQIWRTGTAFFTPAQRGAYLDLLLSYWELGPIPNDDPVLQQLARCKDKDWRQVRLGVLGKFREQDGLLFHERADIEKQKARQHYSNRVKAGQAGGKASGEARSKQTRSKRSTNDEANVQTEVQATPNTTYLVPTPNGVTEAKASVARKPRRTRLANDWQPSEADNTIAVGEGLTAEEIATDLAEWREYWLSDEPRDGHKADWSRTYRKHIMQYAPGIIARRAHGGRSKSNGPSRGSVFDALRQNLTETNREDVGREGGVFGGVDAVQFGQSGLGFGSQRSHNDIETVNDPYGSIRVPDLISQAESPYSCEAGINRRYEADPGDLRGRTAELSSGCSSPCVENPTQNIEVVADLGGTGRTAGILLQAPSQDVGSNDFPPLPDFLKRTG